MAIVRRAFGYVRPHWPLAATSVLITIASSLVSLLAPWPLKILVDNVLQGQPWPPMLRSVMDTLTAARGHLLWLAIAGGLAVALLTNGLHVLANYVHTKMDQWITLDFRSHLFLHAQRMSLAYHDRRRSGMIIYMINSQGDAPAGLIMTVPMLAESALTLIGMIWITYQINPMLALVSLSVVPFLYYSVGYYATHVQERIQKVRGMECESLSIIHESISMMRVIVAFGREEHEFKRFREQTRNAVAARVQVTVRQTIFSLAVNMITAIGSMAVLAIGANQVIQHKMTVGQLLVVIAYVASVYKPLETISHTMGTLQDRFVNLRATFGLLDTEPDIQDAPDARSIGRAAGGVRFEGVDFSYSGREDTLRDISFEALPGQVIGIVGPTGAGKSTLVSLLPRFYDLKKGRILIDGVDARTITLASLREQISIVLQEPLLFSGTIAENIRYGRLDATDEEIVAAAQAANAHDFIMRLPQKYETVLGERGAAISGGERQRISVARAFLKDAPILILDEPTSAVDSKTEAVILEALERLMAGRTTFMIAHRLSTLHHADRILVMQHGRVVEQGTHQELVTAGGLYQELHQAQSRSRRSRGAPADPAAPTAPTAQ